MRHTRCRTYQVAQSSTSKYYFSDRPVQYSIGHRRARWNTRFTEPDNQAFSSLSDFFSSMSFGESKRPSYRHLWLRICFSWHQVNDSETSTRNPRLSLLFCDSLPEKVIPSILLQALLSLTLHRRIPTQTFLNSFGKCQYLGIINFDGISIVDCIEATADKMAVESQVHAVAAFIQSDVTFNSEIGVDFKVFESWLRIRYSPNVGLRKLRIIYCIGEPEVRSLRRLSHLSNRNNDRKPKKGKERKSEAWVKLLEMWMRKSADRAEARWDYINQNTTTITHTTLR